MLVATLDNSRALVPVQAWIQPLYSLDQKRMILFREDERSRGGFRFLGYRMGEVHTYGAGGKALQAARQGVVIDLYV